MARVRISTTVDGDLLEQARRIDSDATDSALLESALTELLRVHRRAEIDKQYEAYDRLPLDTPDAWGDLESFLNAAK